MIGSKRKVSRGLKPEKKGSRLRSMEDRMKSIKSNKNEEEEIASNSEEEKNLSEEEDETKGKSTKKENTDEKRLRLAKKLINKIETEVLDTKEKDRDYIQDQFESELINDEVDQYILDEIKKEKKEYFTQIADSPDFNPMQTSFFKGHLSSVTSVDISSDSNFAISCSKDCRAIQFDLNTGKKILLPKFSNKPLFSCLYSPDSKCAYFAGSDRYIHKIDLHNQKVISSFKAHNDTITGLIFDEKGEQFYSVSRDNTLKVWAGGNTSNILLETFYGHIDKINDIDISEANRIFTCGSDRQINLWKVDSQSFLNFKEVDNSLFSYDSIKCLDKTYFLSGSSEGTLSLWRNNKKKPVFKLNNSHGYEKTVKLQHNFFRYSDEDFELMSKETNDDEYEKIKYVNITNPIISLGCVKNSDLIFSGSIDGNLNFYKFSKVAGEGKSVKEKLESIKSISLNTRGVVNMIKADQKSEYLVLALGKDSRLGRWDTVNKGKNGIGIVKLYN
jgi:ribosomal RNA-processing protein 9